MNSKLAILSLIFCLSASAGVSIKEKENRVNFIESIGPVAPSVSIEAYRRELNYERAGLSFEERAQKEANLLAEKIKNQISLAYEAELGKSNDSVTASNEIRNAIQKDLALAAPEFRQELETLAYEALTQIVSGGSFSQEIKLDRIEEILQKSVEERSAYLTSPDAVGIQNGSAFNLNGILESGLPQLEYSSKQELVDALVSDSQSTRWVSTANSSIKSAEMSENAARISLQVKIEFLGVSLEAGPRITFKRKYNTFATVMAEGLSPAVLPNGQFDFFKKNKERRFLAFFCDASLEFETEYSGGGGFKVAGIGSEGNVSKTYKNSVTLSSRRILVPETVANQTVSLNFLSEICHRNFLNARIDSSITVADSLNVMMKSSLDSLRYTHPDTKCARDSHCFNWYNNEVLAMVKLNTYPRCVESQDQMFHLCALRGLEGQNCTVMKNGKRVSGGMFEYVCDEGLTCVEVQKEGWFTNGELYQPAKGRCMPINSRTYKSPFSR